MLAVSSLSRQPAVAVVTLLKPLEEAAAAGGDRFGTDGGKTDTYRSAISLKEGTAKKVVEGGLEHQAIRTEMVKCNAAFATQAASSARPPLPRARHDGLLSS